MFKRLWAAIRGWFGMGVRGLENPEVLLRQYMDDVRARVPKMNQAVVEVMKTEVLLRGQIEQLEKKIATLDQQVVAAVKLGPQYENEAKTLIAALEGARESLEDTRVQHESAVKAANQAKGLREEYISTMDAKCKEAMRLIERSKQAKMQEEVASVMMAFEVGDDSDTLDRMKQKVDERAARAQARLEMATSSTADKMSDIRRATVSIGVEDKLLEYKRNLGMLPAVGEEQKVEIPPATIQPATVSPPKEQQTAG